MFRKIILTAVLFICAASQQLFAANPCCVRIRQVYYTWQNNGWVVNTNVKTEVQSGTVIYRYDNGQGIVLTCAHGLDERGPVQLLVFNNEMIWGQIGAIDRQRDLAVINCQLPKNVEYAPMAKNSPELNREATIAGFGSGWWDATYLESKTRVIAYVDRPQLPGHKLIHIDAPTRGGDSGGGLFYDGRLVGVHVSGDGKSGMEVPIEDVHDFLVEKAGWKR